MAGEHNVPKDLFEMVPSSQLSAWAKDPKAVQEATLLDICARAKDTEFGREHDFCGIRSAEDFRVRVPVTGFDDYRGAIERMKRGEGDILFTGPASYFAVTSGTTGEAKFIPDSPTGEQVKDLVVRYRRQETGRLIAQGAPDTRFEGAKAFVIVNSGTYSMTEGGIPAGAASGRTAAQSKQSPLIIVPAYLFDSVDVSTESMNYVDVLMSVANRDVVGAILNNVAHFHTLWSQFTDEPAPYISDIRNGTISCDLSPESRCELEAAWKADPERADELEALVASPDGLTVEGVWPRFGYVRCWLAGSVGRFAEEFRGLFPERTLWLDWGYGASEGKFNIPCMPGSPAGYPAVFGYYFEFLRPGEEVPLTLEETCAGERYELVVTSYSGLYRYNIHDLVEIGQTADGAKTMHFVCKTSDKVTIAGHTLFSGDVIDLVRDFEAAHPASFLHAFRAKVEEDGLVMYVEPSGELDDSAFAAFATERLATYGIRLHRVERLDAGAGDAAMIVRDAERVKTVNSTKVQIFMH